MKKNFLLMMFVSTIVLIASCGGNTDVVDSGTYKGEIREVVNP